MDHDGNWDHLNLIEEQREIEVGFSELLGMPVRYVVVFPDEYRNIGIGLVQKHNEEGGYALQ